MAVYIKRQDCKIRKTKTTIAVQTCGNPPYEIALRFAGCSLKCLLCFAAGYSYADKFKTHKDVSGDIKIETIIDDFKAIPKPANYAGYNWLRILGGEPLLNNEYIEYLFDVIIKLAEIDSMMFKNGIVIQTNGIHIGRGNTDVLFNKLQKLLEINPTVRVIIETSIKGTNPDEFQIVSQMPGDLFEYNINSYFNLKKLGLKNLQPMVVAGFGINTSSLIGNGQNKITLFKDNMPFYHYERWDTRFKQIYKDFTETYSPLDPLFDKMPMYGIEDRPNWRWCFPAIKRGREKLPDMLYDNKYNPVNHELEKNFDEIKKYFFFKMPEIYYTAMLNLKI
jgi:uncharacterized Fe-S cluster-containing radical SAM superfamily protein